MRIFIWLWTGLMLIYSALWWYQGIDRMLHPKVAHPVWLWGVTLVYVGGLYAYEYWQNRRDARDMHSDLRGKKPDQPDNRDI